VMVELARVDMRLVRCFGEKIDLVFYRYIQSKNCRLA